MTPFLIRLGGLVLVLALFQVGWAGNGVDALQGLPLSEETENCLVCHEQLTPGIVADWRSSRHAVITPEAAREKPRLERSISAGEVPAGLARVVTGCYECHGLNPSIHTDNFEHMGYRINVVVSPADCGTCHPVETEEYAGSKKAHAVDNLEKNSVYHTLVETSTGVMEVHGEEVVHLEASAATKAGACLGCHGTRVVVKGMKTVSTEFGDIEVPDMTNWPNQGVGRVNPDGSLGSCAACHPRHSFSVEIARKPYTCLQCHLEPDVPAWDVYRESKHGNIFLSRGDEWDWSHVPWRAGQDFSAPTCAACHASLLVSPEGEVIVERNHDFGSRLWVRLFGLIYSHPQPKEGETYKIRNADGLPLPVTFTGELASSYLINSREQSRRKETMKKVCRACHSTDWAEGHFARLDTAIVETDRMVRTATSLMMLSWDEGLADRANPFDEVIERMWQKQWLFYANSIRYAAAMGGPDYATFKNGWWDMTQGLQEMKEWIDSRRREDERAARGIPDSSR